MASRPKRSRTEAASSSNPVSNTKPDLTRIYKECFNEPRHRDAMNNFKEFENHNIRRERRPDISFLTSNRLNFRYLDRLNSWKLMPYLRLPRYYYHNLVLIFYSNARCIFNEDKDEVVAVESYLMGKTFRIDSQVIADNLGIENIGVADEDVTRHVQHGSVTVLDAHDRLLHLLITWCFRPSGGKWSTIRLVDSFWLHCFRQGIRPNLAQIIFIELVEFVKNRHYAMVQSFSYGVALSHIFEKLHIDCSADHKIPLTDPISEKSLRKAKFTFFNGEWVRNADLPHDVPPADAGDAPQAPLAPPPPPPQAFSLDPMMAYLGEQFAALNTQLTSMDQRLRTMEARQIAMEERQTSMDITLNAFRGEWRGQTFGPSVMDEEDEDEGEDQDGDGDDGGDDMEP